MKTGFQLAARARVALLGALLAAGCGSRSSDIAGSLAKAEPVSGPYAELAQMLDSRVSDGTVSGYSFVLSGERGEEFERSLGVDAQGREFTADLPVPLASASKAIAAAAIMTLVDRGRLNLDAPVYQYLRGTSVNWPDDEQMSSRKSQITMRMLLSHTSGLPGLNETPPCVLNPNYEGGLEACVAFIAGNTTPLRADPGAVFIYGGTGFQVAGFVALTVSGAASWPEFFSQAMAVPLGTGSQFYYENVVNPRIAGGAWASARAYGVFQRMLLNHGYTRNGRLLSGRSVIELCRNQLRPPATENDIDTYSSANSYTPYGLIGKSYPYYGLGSFIEAQDLYQTEDYYSPGPEISSQGLYGATPWIDFGLDYATMLLLDEELDAPQPETPSGSTEDKDPPGSRPPVTAPQKAIDMWNELRPLVIRQMQ